MRRYETVFIVDSDLSEKDRNQRFEKVKSLVKQYKGSVIEFDDWGVKKLQYSIRKKNRGHYIRLDYCSNPDLVAEMERIFRLDDKFLKYMTILLDNKANPEKILSDIAKEKEAKETKASEEQATKEAAVKEADTEEKKSETEVTETESSEEGK